MRHIAGIPLFPALIRPIFDHRDFRAEYDYCEGMLPICPYSRGGEHHHRLPWRGPGEPHYGCKAVLVAELGMSEIPQARLDFDATGHDARPDVFELRVDGTALLWSASSRSRPVDPHQSLRLCRTRVSEAQERLSVYHCGKFAVQIA